MSKNDWTVLFVRVVGLYLVATHLAAFATTTASLIIALTHAVGARQVAANIYLWQGPVVSALTLGIGLLLVLNARSVGTILQKNDAP